MDGVGVCHTRSGFSSRTDRAHALVAAFMRTCTDFKARVLQIEAAEEAERYEKMERRKQKKEQEKAEAEAEAEDGMDPAMAAMMGFSGFGGSSKN